MRRFCVGSINNSSGLINGKPARSQARHSPHAAPARAGVPRGRSSKLAALEATRARKTAAMTPQNPKLHERRFPTAEEDALTAQPASRYDGPESSFRLAFTDERFLLREELRP